MFQTTNQPLMDTPPIGPSSANSGHQATTLASSSAGQNGVTELPTRPEMLRRTTTRATVWPAAKDEGWRKDAVVTWVE